MGTQVMSGLPTYSSPGQLPRLWHIKASEEDGKWEISDIANVLLRGCTVSGAYLKVIYEIQSGIKEILQRSHQCQFVADHVQSSIVGSFRDIPKSVW